MGIYHEKLGIFYDIEGNKIAFTGSMNETITAFTRNYESVDVYRSWTNEDERDRVLSKERAFNALWNDDEPDVTIIDFPQIVKEKLMTYKTGDIVSDIDEQEFMTSKNEIPNLLNYTITKLTLLMHGKIKDFEEYSIWQLVQVKHSQG